ncbi:MAG: lipoate--protein ligase family protein [Gemmatimonadetes bacterium]|nr:lipoate--protein ligase family protein [Gemmatimonadota bacterium]MCY3944181.1 lipoate--protein ligase family protein [Gemmatimonadota bacterium]
MTGGDLGRLSWRILVDGPLPGAANMARDHALAELVGRGEAVLRLYRWRPAALSLGRNEPFGEIHRRLLASRPDVGVVRRPTGGRAVLHDRELTYGVAAPVSAFGGLRAAYRAINRALVEGLGRLGVAAELARPAALPPGAGVCFADSAEGEVVAAGRKLVGSAQRRVGGAFLQHGSLLLDDDQGALLASAGAGEDPGAEAGSGPATLADLLGAAPPWSALTTALADGFAAMLGGSWRRAAMTPAEVALSDRLMARYDSREWTRRREDR